MWFITLVFRNLLFRRIRSLLTCLGMGVAVCAVVTMIGVADVFEKAVSQLLETRGVDLVVSPERAANRVASTIPESLGERLKALPGVRLVEPLLVDMVSFPEKNLIAVYILGWDIQGTMFNNLKFTSGGKPSAQDSSPVILGYTLAANLDKKVGDSVTILDQEFNVVGIYESYNIFENSTAVISIRDLQKLLIREGRVNAFLIGVEESSDKIKTIEDLTRQIQDMKDEQQKRIPLSARATQDHIKSSLELQVVKGMAWSTSFIALVIGVIGMLNTMMISVFERTKEIGTMRAVGWPQGRVMRMILLESLILAGLGSLIGVAGSFLLTLMLSALPAASALILPSMVNFAITVQATALAMAAGFLGALYPAWVASRLLPSEALRHD